MSRDKLLTGMERFSQSLVDEHQHCINVISPHIETEFMTNTAFSSTCVNRVNVFRRVPLQTALTARLL